MSDYRHSSTYAIVDSYTERRNLEDIVNQMWCIRERCEIVCAHRGDLTGIVYSMGYTGLEDAADLLSAFERKLIELKECIAELKKELPAPDFEYITRTEIFFDGKRKGMQLNYDEIRKYFDLTHEHYQHCPPPKSQSISKLQYFIHLAAYASLAYLIYHFLRKD